MGHLFATVLLLLKITLKATSNGNDCTTFKKLQGKQITLGSINLHSLNDAELYFNLTTTTVAPRRTGLQNRWETEKCSFHLGPVLWANVSVAKAQCSETTGHRHFTALNPGKFWTFSVDVAVYVYPTTFNNTASSKGCFVKISQLILMRYFRYWESDVHFRAVERNKQQLVWPGLGYSFLRLSEPIRQLTISRWVRYTSFLPPAPTTHPHCWPHVRTSYLKPALHSSHSSKSQVNTLKYQKIKGGGEGGNYCAILVS